MRILLPLILITTITGQSLFCNIYDHSNHKVACTDTCPSTATLIGNKCLNDHQYLYQDSVFICQGVVSTDHTVCCPNDNYMQNGQCLPCHGQVFNKGLSCCGYDHYIDLSGNTPNCVALTTGACASLQLNSPFKICCPAA